MVKKILGAASWLGLVQIMNVISVIVLSILVIRRIDPLEVSSYMYAVFTTDAVMSYTLLQIALRITLAKDDATFKQLFAYSRRFSFMNASLAIVVMICVIGVSDHAVSSRTVQFVAWLTVAGIANYFAQLCFSVCDYKFNYKSFGVSSALANIGSLAIAVTVFLLGGGIISMVVRDVARSLILLALALKNSRTLIPDLAEVQALDRESKLAFLGFLVKRHTLKVMEVTNHRVPALITSVGNVASLGNFGVAFQFMSQIMNVLTIAGDKVAYSFFARAESRSKLRYLWIVMAMYAAVGLFIFVFGERLFSLVYGPQWQSSARTFSYLGIYLFSHGALGLITNFLVTEQRFAGVYLAWGGWTATFFSCFMYDASWPIVRYYLTASLTSFVLAAGALLWVRYRHAAVAVPHTV